jgi:hypothetical protein
MRNNFPELQDVTKAIDFDGRRLFMDMFYNVVDL